MDFITEIKGKVLKKLPITQEDAFHLFSQPLDELCRAANEIRIHFCQDTFDICTIINAKSGHCSENCKYCAQSMHYDTSCEEYPLLSSEEIVNHAKYNCEQGVLRYSLVTSGRTLGDDEVEKVCATVAEIKEKVPIQVCGSFGLLKKEQYQRLYESGLTRIHNNLETSKSNFPNMCTTHSFEDKVSAIGLAKEAGMYICSGGIFGIGESIQDRIDLAFSLKELGIKSIPINLLNPVKGTPYEGLKPLGEEEIRRIVAVYRFILPDAYIRLAGGRGLLLDKGRSCFLSGANAAISGDMLTTAGISIETDLKMIAELGFEVKSHE
ncbi:biotin synthase BioB [Anaerotignum sp. MB30-C6]|uniref:biotin synthase BioB n=1 Tax=Anaerotignum sp. MB30-C6 TaxID=3070814 RepID=UPI0027DD4CC3|nr:biotin synthase BioB [Anaerotignum sp. MB30-C6]WMI79828.1 biotin synthase BioB [Anaerotignum sp. MB30-C6]